MNKPILLIISLMMACMGFSQTKMVIERIQCTSSFSYLFNYLNNPEIKAKVYWAIKTNAVNVLHVSFDQNEPMPVFDIRTRTFGTLADRDLDIIINKPQKGLHLFVNINENSILLPKGKKLSKQEIALLQTAGCVINLQLVVTDNDGNIKLDKMLDFAVQNKNTNSIGYLNKNYSMSPTSFIEFTQKATKILLDTFTNSTDVQIAYATPAYFADNFIMPNIASKKRIIAETKNDFAIFTLPDSSKNMLRFPNTKMYLMNLKKKGNATYNIQEQAAISYKKQHGGLKYCSMQHEFRNVLGNKNYTSHIAVAIDDEGVYEPIFKFLPNRINFLLADKDTVAWFNVYSNFRETGKTVFIDRVYNGIDTSTQLVMFEKNMQESIVYSMSIEGEMGSHSFNILYSGIDLKEIFYDKQLVCVVKGEKLPEAFVLINANLPKDILHQLLMLAFIKTY